MRFSLVVFLILSVLLAACQPGGIPASGGTAPAAQAVSSRAGALPTSQPATATTAPSTLAATAAPTSTPAPTATATPTPEPEGVIHVDTLEQEVYPFPRNGNCSLAEAISAANLLQPVDGCPAGVDGQTIIELMPGTYRLTKLDTTPQQVAWAVHTSKVGNALPAVARPVVIHGNGAVLLREGAAEPFRVLEILYGVTSVDHLTIQGGDAGPDNWGGGILVQHASLHLDNVLFTNNRAENGAGFYLNMGDLTIRDSEFRENTAFFSGGGFYAGDANIDIRDTRFIRNHNNGFGGGLYADRVTITITDTLFLGNVNEGTWGGGLSVEESNATILRAQFYNNVVGNVGGGAGFRNYIHEEDIAQAEADPLDVIQNQPFYQQLSTQIPGFQATLQAAPGGMFKPIKLDIQIHDSCFQGNVTHFPGDPNWTSAIAGRSNAENNYYGDPSGPGGMGPGTGDMVGKRIVFAPFLSAPPAHCDLSLAK